MAFVTHKTAVIELRPANQTCWGWLAQVASRCFHAMMGQTWIACAHTEAVAMGVVNPDVGGCVKSTVFLFKVLH
jgi:hypothetical protein